MPTSLLSIRELPDSGGASLGATGAEPHFIFGDQKKKKKGEWIFKKQFEHCIYNLLKKESSSMDKSVFENPPLKYIACFNIRDNEKQENIGTAFC
jgi:hypothetical protein